MENPNSSWENSLSMAIFHSYVCLPEGKPLAGPASHAVTVQTPNMASETAGMASSAGSAGSWHGFLAGPKPMN